MRDLWRKGQFLPITLMGVSIWLAIVTWQMREPAAFNPVSARVWPAVLLVTMALCSIIIFIENRQGEPSELQDEGELAAGGKGWAYAASIVAATLVLPFLGYLITLVLFVAVTMLLYDGLRHPLRLVLTSLIGPAFVYVIITRVLGQALPDGMFF